MRDDGSSGRDVSNGLILPHSDKKAARPPDGRSYEAEMTATSLPALSAAFLMSMYFRSYFGVVGPALTAELGLSPQQYGWLASAFFASFSILQIPVGMSFDRWGVRFPMAAMMACGAAAAALIALTPGYQAAIMGQILIGVGCAPIFMGVLFYVGRTNSPAKAGRLAATVSGIGSMGALISASPLSWFVEVFGWRSACWAAASAMAASAIAVCVALGKTPSAASEAPAAEHRRSIVPLLYLVPICMTLSLGGTFRNAWAAPYVTSVFGTHTAIGEILTAISIVGIVTSVVLPAVLARVEGRRIVIFAYVAGVICAVMLSAGPDGSFPAACAGLSLLYAMGNVHPLIMTEAQARIPSHMRGIALGVLNTLVFLGVSVASVVFGQIAGLSLAPTTTYRLIFAATGLALAIALLSYVIVPRSDRTPRAHTDNSRQDAATRANSATGSD
ncbi:MFS transporter [Rhizobium sp. Rhizsp82]|uniref:MFS transporter n=1 Tax=Rhizobium sp. Rhizsp82 TaxID=3243057 RepID=UPI0039B58E1E